MLKPFFESSLIQFLRNRASGLTAAAAVRLIRLARQRRAATALEFAIIGAVFFVLVFGIFIVSVNLFWQLTLDDAVRNATRQVQIGKVTTGADFVTSVCNEFGVAAPNCAGRLQYSVQGGSYFGTGGIVPTSFGSDGNLAAQAQFTGVTLSSSAGAVFLVVQVAYPLPFTVLLLPPSLATENGTSSLYSAASTVMVP